VKSYGDFNKCESSIFILVISHCFNENPNNSLWKVDVHNILPLPAIHS
jgi:hypothetical protein